MPAPRTTSRETRSAILAKHAALDVNTLIKAKTYIRKADLVLKQVRPSSTHTHYSPQPTIGRHLPTRWQ